jgi:ABC-type transporter Mla MlaB component
LDLAGLQRVDVGTVDWIARLNYAARRTGIRLRLKNVNQALAGLICFCGLAEALGLEP